MQSWCPFGCQGQKDDYCPHLLGWTEKGDTIDMPVEGVTAGWKTQRTKPGDAVIYTGVSYRVYRQLDDSEPKKDS